MDAGVDLVPVEVTIDQQVPPAKRISVYRRDESR
jgi:hypothetical protein